ncbi:NAD-dependent epimerase/dehydratase family protein [Roseibium aggregatum]|uniref:NAD-dependent epimerase/dehydratase family protein n=1 Tax=Roseibium aggregatum TaxID=187304 RepID=UPI001A8C4DB7|nr:NAD-dependent epimerase/dehydratase family protein [Roseibium aggregatum]MBN8181282.1 NAD-dependent epimerase/dehydratase family protein [Roseibium aggregatum]UES43190.1 NAD-dependent epimerase/dehydratase family protein [Roseibium aggregatum]
MTSFSTDAPVLVTGATGYVAGWLVKELLDAGITVHAAIRDPDRKDKVAHLQEIAAGSPGTLRFFRADLLEEGSYAEAMAGCATVFHTASPFTTSVKDPQRELIAPAVKGTRSVLETAARTASVKRVVVTSSCAAIYTDAIDCLKAPGGKLTEEVWNTTASLDYQPYSYSKTLAEQEAWKIARAQDRFKLVTVNPSLVIGPALNARPTSESFNIVRQMGDGTMKRGAPKLGLGVVDVRDLSRAHMEAGFREEAEGRHIISGHDTNILELGKALIEKYGDRYPVPRQSLPKWIVWLAGPIVGGISRKFVTNNVDVKWRADNSKSKRALGVTYRPMKTSMEEMFQQMIDTGVFGK